jgi:two-component system, NarL family, sensor kinase
MSATVAAPDDEGLPPDPGAHVSALDHFLPQRFRRAPAPSQSVAGAVLRFALTGIAALALLAFVSVEILQRVGRREAIRDAKVETRLAGEAIVAPALTPGLLTGSPRAVARLDRIVHRYVLRDPVVRVKIWDAHGRILYSDEHRLIGSRYSLGADERGAALRPGAVEAEVSDLTKPENRFERRHKKLLEVYLGIRGPRSTPLLYEEYLRYSSVAASGNRLWSKFAPALFVALILLELSQVPSAVSLARRVQRGQREREALLRRSLEASDLERRRIASNLHDGVVQTLAGVSYTLSAAGERLADGTAPDAAQLVDGAAADTRQSIRELRTLLVDIYPPTLRTAGLKAALSDLLAPLESQEIATTLELPSDLGLPEDREPVVYRVAQEALRNVAKHSDASRVLVRAERENGHAVLTVEDDGRGFASDAEAGHFGLRIMEDLARDAGGRLVVESAPGEGTRVELEVPVA